LRKGKKKHNNGYRVAIAFLRLDGDAKWKRGKYNGVVDGVVGRGVGRGIFREIGTRLLRCRCTAATLPLYGSEPALRLAEGRRGPDRVQPVTVFTRSSGYGFLCN